MGEGGPSLLLAANERLVRSALAANEAAQRAQALREEIQGQNKQLRAANDALVVTQQALGDSERRYHSLFEQLAEGFALHEIILDEKGRPYDYRFLDINPAFERLTGLDRGVVGRTVREVLPDMEGYWIDCYGEVALTGQAVRFENCSQPLGKHYEVIAFSPARGQFATLFLDVSERKRAEDLKEAVNSIDQIIHSTLDFDTIIRRTVSEAAKVFGCETAAVSLRKGGHWVVSYVHGLPQEMIGSTMNDDQEPHAMLAITTRAPIAIGDAFNDERVNREHMRKWGVRSILVVPFVTRNEVIGVLCCNFHESVTFADYHVDFAARLASSVTLALQNARLVERLERELAERRKAEQFREEYVSLISHDLRGPLTSVLGMAQMAERTMENTGPARLVRLVAGIAKAAKLMEAMIRDLVETTQLEAGRLELHREPADLACLVLDVVDQAIAPEGRERIRLDIAERVRPVLADTQRLERAIANLVTNALKYSPTDKAVVIGVVERENRALLYVADEGVGISPEDVPHMFQRHFRAKTAGKREGLGLGLYITRLIVEAHGGEIRVESLVGKGSAFHISLPLA